MASKIKSHLSPENVTKESAIEKWIQNIFVEYYKWRLLKFGKVQHVGDYILFMKSTAVSTRYG